MDKNFLNNIQFNSDIKLKRPKKNRDKPRRFRRFPQKILRLVFFISVLVALFYGGKYFLESAFSFCQGTEHQTWEEISDKWDELQGK